MKKVTVVFTGVYPKFNKETGERKMVYNYVVVKGDVKNFIADKTAGGHLSLMTQDPNGSVAKEHLGLPRFVSTKNLGMETELQQVTKKDGSIDWYTDDLEQMIIESEINSLPAYAKAEYGKALATDALARAKATALAIKAQRAKQALVVEDLKKS